RSGAAHLHDRRSEPPDAGNDRPRADRPRAHAHRIAPSVLLRRLKTRGTTRPPIALALDMDQLGADPRQRGLVRIGLEVEQRVELTDKAAKLVAPNEVVQRQIDVEFAVVLTARGDNAHLSNGAARTQRLLVAAEVVLERQESARGQLLD